MLEEELKEIGLSDKEARVYLAALELGQSSAQQIAAKAQVNRATTYVAIESLTELGFMASFYQGKKQFFVAANPDHLIEFLELEKTRLDNRKDKILKLMPRLQSINNREKGKPVVKYYEGKEGLKALNKEYYDEVKGEVYTAYNLTNLTRLFTDEERMKMRADRVSRKINIKVIYTTDGEKLPPHKLSQRHIVPFGKYPISGDIAVYGDFVRFASFTGRVGGILIEDRAMAETVKALLKLAFERSRDLDKKSSE